MNERFQRLISSETTKKCILITLVNDPKVFREYLLLGKHPALAPNSITLATDAVTVSGVPFLPFLTGWPEVTDSIEPFQRTMSSSGGKFTVLPIEYNFDLRNVNDNANVFGRIDYYVEGMTLDDVVSLTSGKFSSSWSDDKSTIECNIEDSIPATVAVLFPNNSKKIDKELFPKVQSNVDGKFARKVLLGEFQYPLLCPCIDNGTLFYVCDHELEQYPTEVQINGLPIEKTRWQIEVIKTDTPLDPRIDPEIITVIRIDRPIELAVPYITCSNGIGIRTDDNPPIFLLEKYGNFKLSRKVRDTFKMPMFDMTIQVETSEDVLKLVQDRIIPQTNYLMAFKNSEIILEPIIGRQTNIQLKIGSGLIGRTNTGASITAEDIVYNAIDIQYRRNPEAYFDSDIALNKYYLDKDNAPLELAEKLRKSYTRYGPRLLRLSAPDIINRETEEGVVPPQIKDLAYQTLQITHTRYKIYEYYVYNFPGFYLKLNDIVELTDPLENLSEAEARVIGKTPLPNCMKMSFMVE